MNGLISTAVIILLIIVGSFLIHRLNTQHAQRIASFHYSDPLPTGRPPEQAERPEKPSAGK
ncbi:hypothetical protein [Streptomyces sp. NPDC051567]|uniref:hypothetical protein n=1 Tax=Streptomyces sp. NPDC051567 TaxID=3365660 RepID=UPI0037B815A2